MNHHLKRVLEISITAACSAVLIVLITVVVKPTMFAAAPAGGYAPGAILDPDCAPGDSDCSVIAPITSGSTISVRAVATSLAAFTRTTTVITADANGAIGAQDGVTLVAGDEILVDTKYATGGAETPTAADSGIYTVTTVGDGSTAFVLTRHYTLDSDADLAVWIATGKEIVISEGTLYGAKNTRFRIDPGSVGTTLGTDSDGFVRSPTNMGSGYISGLLGS